MKVGFTGTRRSMTEAQGEKLIDLLTYYRAEEFHHGDCVGSDAQAHDLVRQHFPSIRIITHPPTSPRFRANCRGDASEPPREYMSRNHRIVDISGVLIATPAEAQEILRSGTWATIRYARKVRTPRGIINPNGEVSGI